ncbi:hypothetical protein [Xylanibacter ruminicola]|uniref:hypothetical protein n=1 Tax=Xylanibacter ruminicola TaxID=839 RepID=UPI00048F7B98|nr:hypothetical protein [Xylanibacter ruminicola]
MKRLILKILLFLLICVVVDRGVGATMRWLMSHAQSGETYRNYYMFNKMKDDVLIFGSSRAMHHYNPLVIEGRVGVKCYNCGISGYGIILFYPRLMKILERYQPKLIIYDVYSSFDLKPGDNHKYLRYVRQIEGCEAANEVLTSIDSTERWKMFSKAYQYNSQLPQSIGDCIKSDPDSLRGFHPKFGVKQDVTRKEKDNETPKVLKYEYDDLKLHYLQLLMETCKQRNISLVIFLSPLAVYEDDSLYEPVRTLCNSNNILFVDYERLFDKRPEMFYDKAHMNAEGASTFSVLVADTIMKTIPSIQ